MPRQFSPRMVTYARSRRNLARRRIVNKNRYKKQRYNVYHIKRTLFQENAISVDTINNTTTSFGFTLGQLPNPSDFTNLYDEYKIKKVVFKLIPKYSDVYAVQNAQNAFMVQVHSAIDYDDALALPSATCVPEICQYQSHKMTQGHRIHTRVIVPKVELTGVGGAQAPKANQWLDCDNTAVLHNGLKLVIPKINVPSGTPTIFYDVMITTYMAFRNVV